MGVLPPQVIVRTRQGEALWLPLPLPLASVSLCGVSTRLITCTGGCEVEQGGLHFSFTETSC